MLAMTSLWLCPLACLNFLHFDGRPSWYGGTAASMATQAFQVNILQKLQGPGDILKGTQVFLSSTLYSKIFYGQQIDSVSANTIKASSYQRCHT